MCWGFVNECISISKAKKFYALIAVSADSAGIFSGQFGNLIKISKYNPSIPYGSNAWEQTLMVNMLYVLAIGLIIIYLYNKINSPKNLIFKPDLTALPRSKPVEEKIKMSLIDCLKYTFRSPYMLSLTMIVVSYYMTYNLFDVIWTDQLQQQFKNANQLNTYLNKLTSFTGVIAASIAFFVSGNVIRNLGWRVGALITPIVMFVTSIGFFSCILFKQTWIINNILTSIGFLATNPIILCGTLQYCLCRASKYTVFDSTKEMAFIPLPVKQQRQGKVVIDTIVSRFSKTGSAVLFHALLIACGTLSATVPYVAAIILALIPGWVIAVNTLNKITKQTIDTEKFDLPSTSTKLCTVTPH
jgi:AAA family ATP:ADP antiporter